MLVQLALCAHLIESNYCGSICTIEAIHNDLHDLFSSVTSMPAQCSACSQPIYNPQISNVLDRSWHQDCVRCVACRCLLNDQCYSRDGKLYCKDDFIKYVEETKLFHGLLFSTEK